MSLEVKNLTASIGLFFTIFVTALTSAYYYGKLESRIDNQIKNSMKYKDVVSLIRSEYSLTSSMYYVRPEIEVKYMSKTELLARLQSIQKELDKDE